MKQLLIGAVILLWVPGAVGDDLEYFAQLSLKTRYLGKLGTTVDDRPVLQPYLEVSQNQGFYASLWLNVPLEEGNPNRSLEIEPSAGLRRVVKGWAMDLFVMLTDFQNPRVLDFDSDVFSTGVKLNNGRFAVEAIRYIADGGRDGLLGSIGLRHQWRDRMFLSLDTHYADGPLHFRPISYLKLKLEVPLQPTSMALFVEVLEVLHSTSATERRRDQTAVGISYRF